MPIVDDYRYEPEETLTVALAAPGGGARFRVRLPQAAEAADAAKAKDGVTAEAAAGRVLVIDDEEHIRTFLTDALQGMGFRVWTAADGALGGKQRLWYTTRRKRDIQVCRVS